MSPRARYTLTGDTTMNPWNDLGPVVCDARRLSGTLLLDDAGVATILLDMPPDGPLPEGWSPYGPRVTCTDMRNPSTTGDDRMEPGWLEMVFAGRWQPEPAPPCDPGENPGVTRWAPLGHFEGEGRLRLGEDELDVAGTWWVSQTFCDGRFPHVSARGEIRPAGRARAGNRPWLLRIPMLGRPAVMSTNPPVRADLPPAGERRP